MEWKLVDAFGAPVVAAVAVAAFKTRYYSSQTVNTTAEMPSTEIIHSDR